MKVEIKQEIYDKIVMMKGKISKNLNSNVTYLITNKVGSEKYHVFQSYIYLKFKNI